MLVASELLEPGAPIVATLNSWLAEDTENGGSITGMQICKALGKLKDSSSIEYLLGATKLPSQAHVQDALIGLSGFGESALVALPLIREIISKESYKWNGILVGNATLQSSAFELIATIGPAAASELPLIIKKLEELLPTPKFSHFVINDQTSMASGCVRALAGIGKSSESSTSVICTLIERLNNSYPSDLDGAILKGTLIKESCEALATIGVSNEKILRVLESIAANSYLDKLTKGVTSAAQNALNCLSVS